MVDFLGISSTGRVVAKRTLFWGGVFGISKSRLLALKNNLDRELHLTENLSLQDHMRPTDQEAMHNKKKDEMMSSSSSPRSHSSRSNETDTSASAIEELAEGNSNIANIPS